MCEHGPVSTWICLTTKLGKRDNTDNRRCFFSFFFRSKTSNKKLSTEFSEISATRATLQDFHRAAKGHVLNCAYKIAGHGNFSGTSRYVKKAAKMALTGFRRLPYIFYDFVSIILRFLLKILVVANVLSLKIYIANLIYVCPVLIHYALTVII